MPDISPVYQQRNPESSQYYRCVEDHLETFEQVYDDRFPKQYGFLRPYVKNVIYRYLDCGILKNGFACVRCGDCGHEYLLTKEGISARPATRKGWLSSGNGYAKKCLRQFPTAILFSAFQRSCVNIFCMTGNSYPA